MYFGSKLCQIILDMQDLSQSDELAAQMQPGEGKKAQKA